MHFYMHRWTLLSREYDYWGHILLFRSVQIRLEEILLREDGHINYYCGGRYSYLTCEYIVCVVS